jgi:arsenite-transporting ATPase
MTRGIKATGATGRIVTPLMRLQDSGLTQVLIVTLPEATPVLQAKELQDDLRRAGIEPYSWIINKSLLATGTKDPLLVRRMQEERRQIELARAYAGKEMYFLPWQSKPPIGVERLKALEDA